MSKRSHSRLYRVVLLTLKGCGYLEGYGHHPGTIPLAILVVSGAFAGVWSGWVGAIAGAGVMAAICGPFYLAGAYERANSSEPAGNGSQQTDTI